jgi:hypothetical protein
MKKKLNNMKKIFLFIAGIFITGLMYAQSVDTSKLKAFVGKKGMDTMTVADFLNYGKVELNNPALQVRSFTIGFTGVNSNGSQMTTAHFHSSDFNRDWAAKAIKDLNSKLVEVSLSEVKYFATDGGRDEYLDKEFTFFLK